MIRWTAFPLIWPSGAGVSGFFVVQALHAVSTGLILLSLQKMIAETVSEERTGAAQGINYFASGFGLRRHDLAVGAALRGDRRARLPRHDVDRAGRPGSAIMARRASPPERRAPAVTPWSLVNQAGRAVARQQQRAVEVDEVGVLRQQHSRRHRQRRADHAADHDPKPIRAPGRAARIAAVRPPVLSSLILMAS